MRRHIVILVLFVALLTAFAVEAQTDYGFPPEMAGEQFRMNGYCVYTSMIYTGAYNLPWSVPNIVGVEIPVGACAEPDWFLMTDLRNGYEYSMTWVEDCGCYADWTFVDSETIRFTSMTVTKYYGNTWTGAFREGTLIYAAHPPQFWYFDNSAPMITAHVNPVVILPPATMVLE